MSRVAVVLFNLGGPDSLAAVRPFLFNLFNDPAILRVPGPLRWCLAQLISRRRAPIAREIYGHIGGKSPLLELTRAQAQAVETTLAADIEVKTFIAMRYWHPMTAETVEAVRAWRADEVVLLPLYPQFSTTTSGSSLGAWRRAAKMAGLNVPTRGICCYPRDGGLIAAQVELIDKELEKTASVGTPRLLMSAHGLPQKVVDAGDPYQWQVEQTAAAIAAGLEARWPELDWRVCYQSRVGPLAWIGPSTEEEIDRAGGEGRAIVVAPIAFVSEHSETLVELDIKYRARAEAAGVAAYFRVPALGTHEAFIAGLAQLVRAARQWETGRLASGPGVRLCPASCGDCAMAQGDP